MVKKYLISLLSFTAICGAAGCSPEATPAAAPMETLEIATSAYDAERAKAFGADEYGMRPYVLVVLKTGPMDDKITDTAQRAEIFKGHFANMTALAEEQKLVLSGPFIEGGDKRGLYIFNVPTIAEAEALVTTDPAVAAGIFVPELTKYYGSAALMDIQRVHQTLQKSKIE